MEKEAEIQIKNYHVVLNVTDLDGKENQVVKPIDTIRIKYGEEKDKNYILLYSDGPMGHAGTYMTKYEFDTSTEPIEYYHIVDPSSYSSETDSSLNRTYKCEWNRFVHENHLVELQIWSEKEKVDTIKVGFLSSLSVVNVKKYGERLIIPENKYGLKGFEFCKRNELYSVYSIDVDPYKLNLFKEYSQIPRTY